MVLYHLRITTDKDINWVYQLVFHISPKFVVSKEDGHYHIFMDSQKERKEIKIHLNGYDLVGNKSFSLTFVKKELKCLSYVLKEGDYMSLGFTDKELSIAFRLSHYKNGFKEKLELLEADYIGGMAFDEFAEKYVELKVDHNYNLNMSQIKGYLEKMRCKKNKNYIRELLRKNFIID